MIDEILLLKPDDVSSDSNRSLKNQRVANYHLRSAIYSAHNYDLELLITAVSKLGLGKQKARLVATRPFKS